MSAVGGKADIIQGVPECPLIAKSGHQITQTPYNPPQPSCLPFVHEDDEQKVVRCHFSAVFDTHKRGPALMAGPIMKVLRNYNE